MTAQTSRARLKNFGADFTDTDEKNFDGVNFTDTDEKNFDGVNFTARTEKNFDEGD
ncbi:MAG: hypothetical protein IJR52_12410 [Selenomonadaceae bacterium]|nr:hypothetical protein [Selenomonadaceae bacterium]MBQ9498358.1 hypothetical protein [Selenomonadaceae bacterium]MBR0287701.1 hypothetical protein [Selenomonadaceae bacterium]